MKVRWEDLRWLRNEVDRAHAEWKSISLSRTKTFEEHFEYEARERDGIREECWQDYEDALEVLDLNHSDDNET